MKAIPSVWWAPALLVVVGLSVSEASSRLNNFELTVKLADSENEVSLAIQPVETVKSLKWNLQDKLGAPVDHQRLFLDEYLTMELTDEHIVEAQQVSTIYLRITDDYLEPEDGSFERQRP